MRFLTGLGLWAALSLAAIAPARAETTAFTGATVIDGTGRAPSSLLTSPFRWVRAS